MTAPKNYHSAKQLLLLLLLLLAYAEASAQDYASLWKLEQLDQKSKKRRALVRSLKRSGYQLDHHALQRGELVLTFENLASIGKVLRRKNDKISLFSGPDTLISLSRNEVRDQLYGQFQAKEKGSTTPKSFRRALKGKRRTIKSKDKPYTLNFGNINTPSYPYNFTFYSRKKAYAQLTFNAVAAQQITEMPYLAYSNCTPFDRNSYFRDISRRSFIGITPYAYTPPPGIGKARSFTLFFDKNKAAYQQEDIADILKFLRDTLYVVEGAEIMAWTSVEGSLDNNIKLQEKRAEVLIRTLEEHQGDSIPYRVQAQEYWSYFFQQLREKGIDSTYRSREEWKTFFNSKEEQEKWEPVLAQQRRASAKLFVTVKLSDAEKHELAHMHFRKLSYSFKSAPGPQKPSIIKTMLGIRNYLEAEVATGRMDSQKLCDMDLPFNGVYEYTLINFYEKADLFDKGEPQSCDFQELALNTFNSIKNVYLFQYALKEKPSPKVYGDLVSIQAYLYQKIIEKKLPPQLACDIYFPDDLRFYHLYLNFLKFTNAMKADSSLVYNCVEEKAEDEKKGQFDWRAIDADSRYYYMLKKIVLEGHKLDVVWRTDWMIEFDIYEFLLFNAYHWDPDKDYFFDQEVGVKEMSAQAKRLIGSLKSLCPHQAYNLVAAFYAKAVQQAYHQQHRTEQLEESLHFLESYFIKHAALLSAEQATNIVRQLLLANNYDLRNERGRFAIDLLERVERRKGFTAEQKDLYFDIVESLDVKPGMDR